MNEIIFVKISSLQVHNASFSGKSLDLYKDFVQLKRESFSIETPQADSLVLALKHLQGLTFEKADVEKVKRFGVELAFNSGREALDFAKENQIPIIFDKIPPEIHAQWQNTRRTIVINDKYKSTKDPAEILAISSAILHELSHAKDNDGISSIQEELDCLAMNALAFTAFQRKTPELFTGVSSPIIDDGVAIYSKLFMGNDENALKTRVRLKYGDLNIESPNHVAKAFAKDIKKDR